MIVDKGSFSYVRGIIDKEYNPERSVRDYLKAYSPNTGTGYVVETGIVGDKVLVPDLKKPFPQYLDVVCEVPFPVHMTSSGILRYPKYTGTFRSMLFYRIERGKAVKPVWYVTISYKSAGKISHMKLTLHVIRDGVIREVKQSYRRGIMHMYDRKVYVEYHDFQYAYDSTVLFLNTEYFLAIKEGGMVKNRLDYITTGSDLTVYAMITDDRVHYAYRYKPVNTKACLFSILCTDEHVRSISEVATTLQEVYKKIDGKVRWEMADMPHELI